MLTIIHMEFKRRRPERFLVHWDTGEQQLISPEIALRYRLAPGLEISEEVYIQLTREDNIQRAKDQMLRYLSIRPHSKKELALKTLRKAYPREAIDAALADLEKVGLINDAAFARQFIQNEMRLRPCGRKLLAEKLFSKGVASAVFEPLIDEILQSYPPEKTIRQLAEKFIRRNSGCTREKLTEKLIRHLQSKGFEWDLIKWVLYDAKIIPDADE